MEAWSVHHKTDGAPTLITPYNYCPYLFDATTGYWTKENTGIFGQELESFNQKSGIIQSGVNTMQTTFVLELNFGSAQYKVIKDPYQASPEPTDIKLLYNPPFNTNSELSVCTIK